MIHRIKGNVLPALETEKGFYLWISCLFAVILLCGFALLASLVTSMEILEFSIKIPWAGMISTYVFLVASGSGLCIINALGAVFGMRRYTLLGKRIAFLSLTLIVFGMLCIVLHLGHPERMPVYNAISPNFQSAISWMGALYSGYLLMVGLELYLLVRPDLYKKMSVSTGRVKTLLALLTLEKFKDSYIVKLLESPKCHPIIGTLAFVAGISALSMLGSVFAHSESRTLWYGPYYPAYFIISAIFCGYAFLIIMTILSHKTGKDPMPTEVTSLIFEMAQVLSLLLSVGLFFITLRIASGLFNPLQQGPLLLLLKGPFSIGFWGFEIFLMSIIPVFLLLWGARRESPAIVFTGCLMVLTGAFVMRYQFVVAGQVFPNITEGLSSYLPTLMEIFVLLGVFAAFLLVYTLGEKFLALKETMGSFKSLLIVSFICSFISFNSFIVFPDFANACGWAGDGEADDDDETIWVGADGNALEDHETLLDDPKFQTRLGNLYREGEDYDQAVHWYRRAASQGLESARNNLAAMYEQGLGITKSDSLAAQWYRLAADQGNEKAQHSLGQLYLEGRGVPHDVELAAHWILKSAQNGHVSAMKKIAGMFQKGLGVPKNEISAYSWWKLAAMHGEIHSEAALAALMEKMDTTAIAKAEKSFALSHIPYKKQTIPGLYLTAKAGYEKWKKNPDQIRIIDTRTLGEYIFAGHGSMAFHIPVRFLHSKQNLNPSMSLNENFVSDVKKKLKETDTIFVMCRSGVRSATAVNLLARAGFKTVYSIIDGFEGDKLNNPDSPNHGKRVINGWKNAGIPWTYDLNPKLRYTP